jgi:hypothetical protein
VKVHPRERMPLRSCAVQPPGACCTDLLLCAAGCRRTRTWYAPACEGVAAAAGCFQITAVATLSWTVLEPHHRPDLWNTSACRCAAQALEERGIGRPSTYAPTLQLLQVDVHQPS